VDGGGGVPAAGAFLHFAQQHLQALDKGVLLFVCYHSETRLYQDIIRSGWLPGSYFPLCNH
jgi:hypothetical protein